MVGVLTCHTSASPWDLPNSKLNMFGNRFCRLALPEGQSVDFPNPLFCLPQSWDMNTLTLSVTRDVSGAGEWSIVYTNSRGNVLNRLVLALNVSSSYSPVVKCCITNHNVLFGWRHCF